MQTGWILSGGRWYYLLPGEGSMLTGWQQIDGVWYYFAPYDHVQYPAGSMFCQEQTPDGYSVDENGRWIA
jgi:glucan-binding YG repeat protein